jgi:hypothetical protein
VGERALPTIGPFARPPARARCKARQIDPLRPTIDLVVITFNEPLEPYSTGSPANYRLVQVWPANRSAAGKNLVCHIVHDPKTSTTTLVLDRALGPTARYELTINGTHPSGVRGRSGVYLDGLRNGRPGSVYRAVIDGRTVY